MPKRKVKVLSPIKTNDDESCDCIEEDEIEECKKKHGKED